MSRRARSTSFSLEAPNYLFSVICSKSYTPGSAQELEMEENEILHVIEDKDLFYVVYSPRLKKKGFVPKNYTKVQKALNVLPGTIKNEYKFVPGHQELQCEAGERVIVLCVFDNTHLYCKKMSRELVLGTVPIDLVFVDGEISTLPTLFEYQSRTTPIIVPEIVEPIATTHTTSKPASEEDQKIMEKLKTSRPRSSSMKVLQQFISPPKY